MKRDIRTLHFQRSSIIELILQGCSVEASTRDFDSRIPGSNPGTLTICSVFTEHTRSSEHSPTTTRYHY